MMNHLTAKVSCFTRAFHYSNNRQHIFADDKALFLLGEDYDRIAQSFIEGISYFLPDFHGSEEEGLRLIVDRQLSPSVLGRSAFCEDMLRNAVDKGCLQYVILAAGYDTFGVRNKKSSLSIFELDLPDVLEDKSERMFKAGLFSQAVPVPCDLSEPSWKEKLEGKGFRNTEKTFGSLLGISYYLHKSELEVLFLTLAEMIPDGSEICFDYPSNDESKETIVNRELAREACEEMKSRYSFQEMKKILEKCGYQIVRILEHEEMTKQYFKDYNDLNPEHQMKAPEGICYVLAERKRSIILEESKSSRNKVR